MIRVCRFTTQVPGVMSLVEKAEVIKEREPIILPISVRKNPLLENPILLPTKEVQVLRICNRVKKRYPINHDHLLIRSMAPESQKQEIPSYTESTGNIKYSPEKLNKLARQIKGFTLQQVIDQMEYSSKKAAKFVASAAKKLVHNAKQDPKLAKVKDKITLTSMIVAQAFVGKGTYEHGIIYHAKGRFGKMTRPYSHLKIKAILAPEGSIEKNRGNLTFFKRKIHVPKLKQKVREILVNKPIISKKLFFDN